MPLKNCLVILNNFEKNYAKYLTGKILYAIITVSVKGKEILNNV